MLKIEKYTGEKTYMYPSGGLATPNDVKSKYPAVANFVHIVETDEEGQVLFALENLSAVKSRMGIDANTSEEDAIKQIEEMRNTIPEQLPTTEERIAAALEFNNLLNMQTGEK